eukprot:gene14899-31638_t
MTVFIFLGSLLAAMAIGIPISFSLMLSGAALMWHLGMFDAQILAQNLIEGSNSFPLLAVPFFMLAGEIMNAGGLSRRIVNFAMALVGHVRGGLGYVGIMAAVFMAALSGSAVADAAALSALLLPMMVHAGHNKARSAGLLASASIIAPLIPPSIGFVIFGVAANVSISKLFLAGIAPGLLLGVTLCITWWYLARKEMVVPPARKNRGEIFAALKDALFALGLPVIVVVGLKFGVFTPTEAAVVAAFYALVVALFVHREMKLADIYGVLVRAAKTTSLVMFLCAGAQVASYMITLADLPNVLTSWLGPLVENPRLLMAVMMIVLVLIGTALDLTPTILIFAPVMLPIAVKAGIDPVYFGLMFVLNGAIGLITPPVGTVLNVVAGVGRISMSQVTRGVMPFMVAQFIVMFLLVLFPSIVLVPLRLLGG